jgi:dTDP-4-amino-4,6-dideoxygalactose transaminase
MNYKIPFAKPYMPNATVRNIAVGMEALLLNDGNRLSNGDNCRKLEEKVAKMSGADHGIACSSCTQAMILGLGSAGAKGIGHIPSFTWASTAVAVNAQGARIYWHDVDMDRWSVPEYGVGIDPRAEGGFAIAVDTFGLQHNPVSHVPLFYDRAHSLGLKFRQLGVASFLSFSPSKLVTAGEGGMILTNKDKFAEAATYARDMMSRMPETSAIMALEGLRNVPDLLEWKRETYLMYKKAFPEFIFQQCNEGESNHQVIGMLLDTHAQQEKLKKELVDTGEIELKMYYEPLHLKSEKMDNLSMPNTMSIYERIVCLNSWTGVDRREVISRIRSVLEL